MEGNGKLMHDELECATAAAGMYRTILDEADRRPWAEGRYAGACRNPERELRSKLPWMFARLSPEARAMLRDHLSHTEELVAFVHRAEHATANRLDLGS